MPEHVEFEVTYNGKKIITTVSKEDWPWIRKYTWTASDHGRQTGERIYVERKTRNGDGKQEKIFLHREITEAKAGEIVDYIDGDSLRNTPDNLRIVDRTENNMNRGPLKTRNGRPCSSKFKGVSRGRRGQTWQANIGFAYKTIFLGTFEREDTAARAYDLKALELYGTCAYLNFPLGEGTEGMG